MNLNAFTLPAARSITVLATKDNGNKNEVRRGTVAGLRDAGLSGDRRKRHAPSMTRLGMRPAVRLHELAYYTTSTIEGTSLAGTRISNLSGWRSSNTFFFFFSLFVDTTLKSDLSQLRGPMEPIKERQKCVVTAPFVFDGSDIAC